MTLADLFESEPDRDGRIFGVVTGKITNIDDPAGLDRVRVRFGWLSDANEGWWARIATPMGGDHCGLRWPLRAGEEVLVAFERGDPSHPYVLGALRNARQRPVVADADKPGQIVVRSRAGHRIALDDGGAGGIEIVDATGRVSIVISSSGAALQVRAAGDVTISAQGTLRIQAPSVAIDAGTSITARSAGSIAIEAGGELSLSAAELKLDGVQTRIDGVEIELGG